MRGSSIAARLALVTCALVTAEPAWAEGPPSPTDPPASERASERADVEAAKERARALVARAASSFREGRFADAGRDYLEAYDVLVAHAQPKKPELLYNAAFGFDRAGACARAAELYERFLALDPTATQRSPELAARIDESRACAPEVVVSSTPSGAIVAIDGAPRGPTPLRTRVEAGDHRITLALAGHGTVDASLTVERGRAAAFARALAPSTETPKSASTTEVRGVAKKAEAAVVEGQVAAGAPRAPDRRWVWVSGGVGAAALAVAVVFRATSMAAVDDYEAELGRQLARPSSERTSSLVRDREADAVRHELVSNVSLGLAVVGLGTAAYLWATAPSDALASSASSEGATLAIDPVARTASVVLPW